MNGLDILNEHIEQGIDFTHIKNNNKNDFSLLGESFFPNLENKYTIIEGFPTPIDTEFNRLLIEYIILNNTYNAELTSTTKTVTLAQLNEKYIVLKNEANSLKTKMNTLGTHNTSIITNITSNIEELNENLNQIQNPLHQMNTQTNDDNINGKLETTSLSMTATYYHYIVYFLVCVTIIAMTFNLLLNPNADVMKSVFVVGGILAIYFISKYIVN
jgi:hypothetical protein